MDAILGPQAARGAGGMNWRIPTLKAAKHAKRCMKMCLSCWMRGLMLSQR